jgi:hypothetical protein
MKTHRTYESMLTNRKRQCRLYKATGCAVAGVAAILLCIVLDASTLAFLTVSVFTFTGVIAASFTMLQLHFSNR